MKSAIAAASALPADDALVALAHRIADRTAEPINAVQRQLLRIGEAFSRSALSRVVKGTFLEEDLDVAVVRQRVRRIVNAKRPDMRWCTGGTNALEIAPNGNYARCPKFSTLSRYIGDLRKDGPIRLMDAAADDMSCTIPCPKQMCFTRNVMRAGSAPALAEMIDRHGIAGVYGHNRYARSNIFIRWKITDVCNFTCSYCTDWRTVNKRGVELIDEEVLAAARRMIGQFDRISLRLTGGEPSARRCYVELMRLIHANLNHFTDIEIRTNLSYQPKHREVLGWDWKNKLHLHIGCHIRDKSFMPSRMVELVTMPKVSYLMKFVSTPSIRPHVEFFRAYFLEKGIPASRMIVVQEVTDQESKASNAELPLRDEVPFARRMLESPPARTVSIAAAE